MLGIPAPLPINKAQTCPNAHHISAATSRTTPPGTQLKTCPNADHTTSAVGSRPDIPSCGAGGRTHNETVKVHALVLVDRPALTVPRLRKICPNLMTLEGQAIVLYSVRTHWPPHYGLRVPIVQVFTAWRQTYASSHKKGRLYTHMLLSTQLVDNACR